MKFNVLVTFFLCSLLLIFSSSAYAYSFEDFVSWVSNIFKITGYQVLENETTTTTAAVCTEASRKCLADVIAECINGNWVISTTCKYGCTNGYCNSEPAPIPEQTTTTTEVTTTQPSVKEQVKCVFTDTSSEQKCYGNEGRFGCYGLGTRIVWKSSCPDGGYAETTIDGNTKYLAFKCMTPQPTAQAATQTVTATTPAEIINEQVKCIFVNSDSVQRCSSSEGATCSGVGSCVAEISAEKGRMITWKSTCGGYAYTIMDGKSEYAEFKCGQISTATPSKAEIQVGTTLQTSTPAQTCTDSDGLNYYVKGYVETQYGGALVRKDYDTCRVINSNTDYYDTADCSGQNCWVLEGSCSSSQTAQAAVGRCPSNICKDGACVKAEGEVLYGEGIREQVICIFHNSDVLINPHTSTEKCYTDDGKFECVWDGGVVTDETGYRYPDCLSEVSGNRGQKLTWKSSCGGYAYSVIDGGHEKVEFKCTPSTNVTAEQISGKGFRYAYWQCYDGTETKTALNADAPCKSSEIWQDVAKGSCSSHCSSETGKCGVNSFSVSNECYVEAGSGQAVFISPSQIPAVPVQPVPLPSEEGGVLSSEEKTLFCKDSCPSEGKCYPFGYRKEGKFCSDNGMFTEQLKADGACENNFECSSNVCVDGKCISADLMQKIIDFFKSLFGSK